MNNIISRVALLAMGLSLIVGSIVPAQAAFPVKYHPGHYMLAFFGSNFNWSADFIKNEPNFMGVQRRYPWKSLEPTRGNYNFSAIEADLRYLQSMPTPKRLIIEITDNGRDETPERKSHLPDYVLTPEFEGGVFIPAHGTVLVTKRWNTAVQDRQIALFKALGARFDKEPFIEGVVLDETANGNLTGEEAVRANYTAEKGYAGQKRIMSGLRDAFPTTMTVQYINWFSGANGADGVAKIKGMMEHAGAIGMGIGGPDVHVNGGEISYPLYPSYKGKVPLAPAVQWNDYDGFTVQQIYDFAMTKLGPPDYLVWEQRQPMFTNEVIPLVRRTGAPTGSVLPPVSSPVPTAVNPPPAPAPTVAPTSATSAAPQGLQEPLLGSRGSCENADVQRSMSDLGGASLTKSLRKRISKCSSRGQITNKTLRAKKLRGPQKSSRLGKLSQPSSGNLGQLVGLGGH